MNTLREYKKQIHGDANSNDSVAHFWLKVLKASYTEFIGKEDEKILSVSEDSSTSK